MGRAWRIEYEGGLYHVLSRGNERRDIFHDDRDRLTFLDAICEMADNYDVDITEWLSGQRNLSKESDQNICRIIFTMKYPTSCIGKKCWFGKGVGKSSRDFELWSWLYPAFSKNTQVNKGRSRFAGLSGVENMHSEQRRNRALVWHDLFGDKPHLKFHANQNAKKFWFAG